MLATVYIETTIPSFYHETRSGARVAAWRDQTRLWWDTCASRYSLFTSQAVHVELSRAPSRKAKLALDMIADVAILDEPPGIADVVRHYIEQRVVPASVGGDAYHLAMASMHAMAFLLTWNCRHLANANKTRHISVVNRRLGLSVPVITTPLNLIPEPGS
ncbi:hypothetical protein RAS1_34770 [Phycisphaerae bacterium RAS1]|nr:hypothetical protein RAS1_34770 [Phycisphaerae bacterium RAS1]